MPITIETDYADITITDDGVIQQSVSESDPGLVAFAAACDNAEPQFGQTCLAHLEESFKKTGKEPWLRIGNHGKGEYPFHLVEQPNGPYLSYFRDQKEPTIEQTIVERNWSPRVSMFAVRKYVRQNILGLDH
jgi:hypothetical protein